MELGKILQEQAKTNRSAKALVGFAGAFKKAKKDAEQAALAAARRKEKEIDAAYAARNRRWAGASARKTSA